MDKKLVNPTSVCTVVNLSPENDLQQNLEKKLFSLKYDSGLKYGDFIKSLQFTKRGISMHLKTSGASFTIN